MTPGFVRAAHRAGLHVHVWTVDDPATMHELLDLGVDGIMTDRPRVLASVFEARGLPLAGALGASGEGAARGELTGLGRGRGLLARVHLRTQLAAARPKWRQMRAIGAYLASRRRCGPSVEGNAPCITNPSPSPAQSVHDG